MDSIVNLVLTDPLFYYTFAAYLILLFFSFGITKIQEKLHGIETLFIAVVIGTAFYFIIPLIYQTTSNFLNESLSYIIPLADHFYLTIPLINLEFYKLFNSAWDYVWVGIIGLFLLYYFVVIISYIFFKTLKFCFDPMNEVYPTCRRFTIIKKLHIVEIVMIGIPTFFLSLSVALYLISLMIQNFLFEYKVFSWLSLAWLFSLGIILLFSILAVVGIFLIGLFMYYYHYKKFICPIQEICQQKINIFRVNWALFFTYISFPKHRYALWIKNHLYHLIILFILVIFLIWFYNNIWPCHCQPGICICEVRNIFKN
jgi:hypothetical protein